MKKLVSILSVVAILIMLMPISMGASFKFTPTASQTRVEAGDTVTISLKLSEIDAGEKGINTFKCTFLYDKNIFEDVSVSSKNNWSITYNDQEGNPQYGTLLAVLISTGVSDDQEIGTITLKVKEGTQGKTGEITFTSVSTNDGKTEISETDKVIRITVNGSADTGNTTDGNTQTGGNTQTDGNTQTGGNTQTDGNTQGSKNEQTTGNTRGRKY